MLFAIILILLVAAIAFFHYVQGFFSATLSAILAIIAAAMAFSYHEPIAEAYFKTNDYGSPIVLLVMFAVIYVILRAIFDKAVPGNIRMPAAADKAGGALMGLIAGVFAVGILAIAAEEMPFAPDIGGYARFLGVDRPTKIPGKNGGRQLDSNTYQELSSGMVGQFDDGTRKSLILPVDDIVIGTLKHLSDDGSLQGSQKLTTVHPKFLDEAFGQRLGIEPLGQHIAQVKPTGNPVSVDGLYQVPSIKTQDFFSELVRDPALHKKLGGQTLTPGTKFGDGQTVGKDQILLVVRLLFERAASDRDNLVRFSPASIRLVGMRKDPLTGDEGMADYFPWGTVEGDTLYVDKPDDFLFIDMGEHDRVAVDLLFVVDKSGVMPSGNKIADGTFIEVKRTARTDLSGMKVADAPKPPAADIGFGVVHPSKYDAPAPLPVKPAAPQNKVAEGVNQATTPIRNNPRNAARGSFTSAQANVQTIGGRNFTVNRLEQSNLLPSAVGLPSADLSKPTISLPATGVEAILNKDKKFQSLQVNPEVAATQLATGDFKTRELAVPDGQVMLQIIGAPASEPLVWAQKANQFELLASDRKRYKPHGVWAVIHQGNEDRLLVRYFADDDLPDGGVTPIPQGKATQVTFAFVLPTGVTPKELSLDNQIVKDLSDERVNKVQ